MAKKPANKSRARKAAKVRPTRAAEASRRAETSATPGRTGRPQSNRGAASRALKASAPKPTAEKPAPVESQITGALLRREQLLELLYLMKLTRGMDEQIAALFRQGKLFGGCYSSLGQEAVAVGATYALGPRDYVGPLIRDIGATLVRGFTPYDVFTQYMGKATSPTGGKDGSSHFGDLGKGVVAPISHLGSLVPLLTGIGLACRMLGRNSVCLTFVGDGGAQVGEVHEGLNFAAVRKAPLILFIENNGWAYSTPVERQAAVTDFADRAAGYGIPGAVVDGNDISEVYRVTLEAVDRARSGQGPTLIEAKTMRMKGHAEHDPARYMPRELLDVWRRRDPIARLERRMSEQGLLDAQAMSRLNDRVKREIRDAVEAAEQAPMPEPATALEGVFCTTCHEVPAVEPIWVTRAAGVASSQDTAREPAEAVPIITAGPEARFTS